MSVCVLVNLSATASTNGSYFSASQASQAYQSTLPIAVVDQWLTPHDEAEFNRLIAPYADTLGDFTSTYESFLFVARRSNPILPACLTGPIDGLLERLDQRWKSLALPELRLWKIKRDVLRGAARYLVAIFTTQTPPPNEAQSFGTVFYTRNVPEVPTLPTPPQKRKVIMSIRLEAYTTLALIGDIFLNAGAPVEVTVFANTPYLPMSSPPERMGGKLQYMAPQRRSSAQLTHTAFWYRTFAFPKRVNGLAIFKPPFIRCIDRVENRTEKQKQKAAEKQKQKQTAAENTSGEASTSGPTASASPNNGKKKKRSTEKFSQDYFLRLSGTAFDEGDAPHRAAMAFTASRILEFYRMGLGVRPHEYYFRFVS